MDLVHALRLDQDTRLAIVGAGGKSSLMFKAGMQFGVRAILSASTHLAKEQIGFANRHIFINDPEQIQAVNISPDEVLLMTGKIIEDGRTAGLDFFTLERVKELADRLQAPLLIEADGSRGLPIKAPADHEPAIPDWVNCVVTVTGLSGIGKPLTEKYVHRPGKFTALTGLRENGIISIDHIRDVLSAGEGGLKNIPPGARRIALLNQADNDELRAMAGTIAPALLTHYDSVVISSLGASGDLNQDGYGLDGDVIIHGVYEPIAGVILSAGGSSRFGKPKMLLPWQGKPLIRHVAEKALAAGLSPVVVVVGAVVDPIKQALSDLPVQIFENQYWEKGQSESLQVGVSALPENTGGAVFMLADQPQISCSILQKLEELHRQTLGPIVAPLVNNTRGNPVLFDRLLFGALKEVTGDAGGRKLFSQYSPKWVTWHDESLLFDVDTEEEYRHLVDGG